MILEYTIKKEDDSKLLKDILKNRLYISTVLLKKLKSSKGILVNSVPTFVNYKVKQNDKIIVNLESIDDSKKFKDKFILVDTPIDILYEDDYLLIINKPSNMPVHPSSDNYKNTLSNIVASYLEKQKIYNIHIITRLDKDTTGICIFAKNSYIQELFIRKKEQINLIKEYLAVCYGIIPFEHKIIEEKIARKEGTIILREVNNEGDYAKTEVFVTSTNKEKNFSTIKVILHTGRTHQIRVHMSYIGYPLLGDDLYANNINDICKYITRQALHAHNISFYHPITNEYINLTAKLPCDIENLTLRD